MRENADDMLTELRKRGFSPVLRESASDGRRIYRVIAASRVDAKEADGTVARLRGMGLEPFVFSEPP